MLLVPMMTITRVTLCQRWTTVVSTIVRSRRTETCPSRFPTGSTSFCRPGWAWSSNTIFTIRLHNYDLYHHHQKPSSPGFTIIVFIVIIKVVSEPADGRVVVKKGSSVTIKCLTRWQKLWSLIIDHDYDLWWLQRKPTTAGDLEQGEPGGHCGRRRGPRTERGGSSSMSSSSSSWWWTWWWSRSRAW